MYSLCKGSHWVYGKEGFIHEATQEGSWHGLERRRSTPLLINYAPLDFFEAMSEGHAFNGQAITLAGAVSYLLQPGLPMQLHCNLLTFRPGYTRAMDLLRSDTVAGVRPWCEDRNLHVRMP